MQGALCWCKEKVRGKQYRIILADHLHLYVSDGEIPLFQFNNALVHQTRYIQVSPVPINESLWDVSDNKVLVFYHSYTP